MQLILQGPHCFWVPETPGRLTVVCAHTWEVWRILPGCSEHRLTSQCSQERMPPGKEQTQFWEKAFVFLLP